MSTPLHNMATFVPSTFTAPDRRKKVITYGKSSRLASIPAPASDNDAPSPERPRKHNTALHGSLKRPGEGLKNGAFFGNMRATAASPDIFDVPSEDDTVANRVKPSKKLPTKRPSPEQDLDLATSKKRAPETSRELSKALPIPRKTEPAKSVASVVKKPQKSIQPPKPASAPIVSSGNPVTTSIRRGRTPQPVQALEQDSVNTQSVQRPTMKPKATMRATTQALTAPKAAKISKISSILPVKGTAAKASIKRTRDIDIFDMPSSDDESHVPTPKASRNGQVKTAKPTLNYQQGEDTDSDNSTASKKRKGKDSTSVAAATKSKQKREKELSLPQRSRKYQKKEEGASPGHESMQPSLTTSTVGAQPALPTGNKARRTRVPTVSVLPRQSITKGQSSPAVLHNMLPERTTVKHSPVAEISEATGVDDGTFYDISESMVTPVRPCTNPTSGSTTPRQKALFGSLLRSSSSLTPMPSISKLQLTDSQPRSLLGTLSRSKSDVSHSAQSKKAKLITSLKPAESSSDDDASESESEYGSEGRGEWRTIHSSTGNKLANGALESIHAPDIVLDNMDVNFEAAIDSQTSQITSGFGNRSRLTYAKSRSYLQEENPEDDLLMLMDLDDPVTLGSQTKDSQTEDEEEASQVRPKHELRRQGQNTKFEWENVMFIDDISVKSTSSIRRSTILELCTKMADEAFAHELLESPLAQQFLNNIATNGEIIFDFAAAVATVFMLRTNPTYTTLDQVYRSNLVASLVKLLDNDTDVQKIAKNRKTNLSKVAQDCVGTFRSTILATSIWSPIQPETVSPQLVALKALDLLVLGLREAGNMESIIDQETLVKLIEIASNASDRCNSHDETAEAALVIRSVFSILEAVSLAKQKQLVWSTRLLHELAGSMPVIFQLGNATTITMAVKLCMNLTNNKPKACQQFSEPTFVQSLVQSIIDRIKHLHAGLEGQRTEVLDTLILSLGAMINLTEHSDQARRNVDDGKQLIETLVKTFVDGSARTAKVSYLHNLDQDFSTDNV
jgi:hypothetical protein